MTVAGSMAVAWIFVLIIIDFILAGEIRELKIRIKRLEKPINTQGAEG